jgi:hypothetical protein
VVVVRTEEVPQLSLETTMRSKVDPTRHEGNPDSSGGPHGGVQRRHVLRLGGIAAAAAVGAGTVLAHPSVAGATTGALQFGLENNAGAASTGLTSTNGGDTLHVTNSTGTGLQVRSGGTAVIGQGSAGGVVGVTIGSGPGVLGRAGVGTGPAVKAEIDSALATGAAMEVAQSGLGAGIRAHIDNTASKSAALNAHTAGPGVGVNASSALGIGGLFAGQVAPIQLVPSTAASHPAKGSAGELFVDHSNRLWFCKGGTNWHQLA